MSVGAASTPSMIRIPRRSSAIVEQITSRFFAMDRANSAVVVLGPTPSAWADLNAASAPSH